MVLRRLVLWIGLGLAAGICAVPRVPASSSEGVPASLDVCFVPPEPCGMRIAQTILQARRSVRVQAYGFDYSPIVDALIADRRRGVDVQIVLDRSNERRRASALPDVLSAGIPVFIDDHAAIAHNKVIIVDACLVIGGSFNYTRSAEYRNAENVTFISGCQAGAEFLANWERRRALSRPASIAPDQPG
jgi:phospholipase D